MAAPDSAPWRTRPAAQAVAASTGGTTFGVQCSAWSHVVPDLPPEVAAMLAPPISVSIVPVDGRPVPEARRRNESARYRVNMASMPPYSRHWPSAWTN